MPRPYSSDLRQRVVSAALQGASKDEVARRFAVGRSSVYRWLGTALSEGRFAARPMRGGPKPIVRGEAEAALERLVAGDNHLTLAEYRDRLATATEVRVHPWTIGRALRRLGLTRKKEDPARRRTGRDRGAGGAPGLAWGGRGHRAGAAGGGFRNEGQRVKRSGFGRLCQAPRAAPGAA
jgi:transposase